MGKDWYWAGRSSKRGGGGAGGGAPTGIPSGCMCAVFHVFDFHPFHFSINQQQKSFKSASCIPEDQSVPKGAEAPRNSLESEDGIKLSSISKEENLKIPKNIRIKTSGSTRARAGNLNDLSSEISSSPGTKTPTLVARLMGLDLLPDSHSSSSSSSSCLSTPNRQGNPHLHHLRPRQHQIMKPRNSTDSDNAAIRSLPETPRMSSARRSDVEHRLSLQINKENMGLGEELELPRFSFSKRKYEEHNSRSRSHYARQIVKQVKESVSRKVGHDITNTVKNREQGREEFVGQFRFNKSPKTSVKSLDEPTPGKHSNPSYSSRLRFMDTKNKLSTKPSPLTPKDQDTHPVLKPPSPPPAVNIQAQLSRILTKPQPQALPEKELQKPKSVPKCKKSTNEKFSSQLKKPPQTLIRNKQEESFIISSPSPTRANDIKTKSKRTHPLPSNLLNNLSTIPNLLPVKTDPSPPATKIPQKQSQVSDTQESKRSTQLSSCSRQTYKQEATRTLATRGSNDGDKSKGASTTGADDEGPEFQYVKAILRRTGVDKCTSTTTSTVPHLGHLQFQWFSPTHPLDPSNFHQLEHNPTFNSSLSSHSNDQDSIFTQKNQLGPRCNRRLLFDLVDEVLLEILTRPNTEKLWTLNSYYYHGLVETVWKRIRSFPRANCQVLEDIDGLIETEDMQKMKVALEEEGEGLVAEIEGNILETLVHEMVMECRCGGSSLRRGRRRLDGYGDGVGTGRHETEGVTDTVTWGGSRDEMLSPMNPSYMEVVVVGHALKLNP